MTLQNSQYEIQSTDYHFKLTFDKENAKRLSKSLNYTEFLKYNNFLFLGTISFF